MTPAQKSERFDPLLTPGEVIREAMRPRHPWLHQIFDWLKRLLG